VDWLLELIAGVYAPLAARGALIDGLWAPADASRVERDAGMLAA
jgi:hypothetical protein